MIIIDMPAAPVLLLFSLSTYAEKWVNAERYINTGIHPKQSSFKCKKYQPIISS